MRARGSWILVAFVLGACGDDGLQLPEARDPTGPGFAGQCDLEPEYLIGILPRDAIASLDEPNWERADQFVPDYLSPESRVIGVSFSGLAYAIPQSVLWTHEVMNTSVGGSGSGIAVTYCPLTGSSLVFDRSSVGGAELGVSGIIFKNNLIMYDRRDPEDSLWPQMLAEARCGSRRGARLEPYPFMEMEWAAWVALHPETWVLADAENQGFNPEVVDYSLFGYPYGEYETAETFFSEGVMPPPDERRFSKERVIGLPSTAGEPGIAFPFGALEEREGGFQVVETSYDAHDVVVLWADEAQGGGAFRTVTTDGRPATLQAAAKGFEDVETGSRWTVDGRAVAGTMAGARLEPVPGTYTAFWRAWAAFHPGTRLWEGGEGGA